MSFNEALYDFAFRNTPHLAKRVTRYFNVMFRSTAVNAAGTWPASSITVPAKSKTISLTSRMTGDAVTTQPAERQLTGCGSRDHNYALVPCFYSNLK